MCLSLFLLFFGCTTSSAQEENATDTKYLPVEQSRYQLQVLGVAQDAGFPQIGCVKGCCTKAFNDPAKQHSVTSLGILDRQTQQTILFEASPDIAMQLSKINGFHGLPLNQMPEKIFITHAHIGHYTGLMYLGREAISAENVDVYGGPRLMNFLKSNGPWEQLVKLNNIVPNILAKEDEVRFGELTIKPISVPHRDEYSETYGYLIEGPNKTILFLPDIDKWEKWPEIDKWINEVDIAFLDGTFYSGDELGGRDMSEIPHPSVRESMQRFNQLPREERKKIVFIHFNHTNPLMNTLSPEYEEVHEKGFRVAIEGFGISNI